MRKQISLLAQLKDKNDLQKREILYLSRRIDRITNKLGDLNKFDQKLRVMVNLETSMDNDKLQGVGGPDPGLSDTKKMLEQSHQEMIRSMHKSLDDLDSDIAISEQNRAELLDFLQSQKIRLASTPSIWPTKGWLSSRFGYRISPFTGQREFHRGIDISTRIGAPVIAPADGIVSKVGWDRGYGNNIVIKHGYGIETRYAHLKKALVKKGQPVRRGETIGLVGNSGRSTGPHLHYEVHLNRMPVNPFRYILN